MLLINDFGIQKRQNFDIEQNEIHTKLNKIISVAQEVLIADKFLWQLKLLISSNASDDLIENQYQILVNYINTNVPMDYQEVYLQKTESTMREIEGNFQVARNL